MIITQIGTELGESTNDRACNSYSGKYNFKHDVKVYTIDRRSTSMMGMNMTYDIGKSN